MGSSLGVDPSALSDSPGLNSGDPAVTDLPLFERFRQGDARALAELYSRYADRIRALARSRCSPAVARHVDPDDVVQSVFRRFWCRAQQREYDVPAGEDLWRLFVVIALNKIRSEESFHRAAKRDIRKSAGVDRLADPNDLASPRNEAALASLEVSVKEALELLPERHRRMIALRIEGFDVAEIATLTGRSTRTVERLLQDARKRLRQLLHEEN